MDIIQNYSFQVVALGCILLSISAGLVGSINLYRGQSLIGDALGHSTFPGIVLAYMLFSSRNSLILTTGAICLALISYIFIDLSNKHSKNGLDINLAIYLSGFFGLGMVLKSYVQGNPKYASSSQAGLEKYIFGQASYMLEDDVKLIFCVTVLCLLLIGLFYKEISILLFDETHAEIMGIKIKLIKTVILFMTILVIGIGIKAVGTILISSFMVIPCIGAKQWSDKFKWVLTFSAIIASISALAGTYISTSSLGLATGPAIIVVSGTLSGLSMVFGKYGLIKKLSLRRREK